MEVNETAVLLQVTLLREWTKLPQKSLLIAQQNDDGVQY